jgi:hypothetical protein
VLAEKFGVLPDQVETMDAYNFRRAVEYYSGESLHQDAKLKSKKRK